MSLRNETYQYSLSFGIIGRTIRAFRGRRAVLWKMLRGIKATKKIILNIEDDFVFCMSASYIFQQI